MIELHMQETALIGVTRDELAKKFSKYDVIRQIERYGILEFMTQVSSLFNGRVLDFGSGTSPYKHLISGTYVPLEKGDSVSGLFDCIICNQVLQYIEHPTTLIRWFRNKLRDNGYLVMTYATNWDEVEDSDLQRFTKCGMTHLLHTADFEILRHERRSQICFHNFKFPLGYGVVARKN